MLFSNDPVNCSAAQPTNLCILSTTELSNPETTLFNPLMTAPATQETAFSKIDTGPTIAV